MKSYQRVLLLFFLTLVVASLLSPWVAALWNYVLGSAPEFSQIFGALFVTTATVLILSTRSLLGLQFLREAGLGPLRHGYRDLLRGFVIAIGSMAVLGVLMAMAGVFTPGFFHTLPAVLQWSVKSLLTALMVGFFEEIFFRGMIFKGLLEDTRPVAAFAVANMFYAAVHFIKPAEEFALSGLDPLAGARYLVQALEPFLDPAEILPGLVGLFVIGLALSYALWRTHSLYLSIGLHAGWVFGLKTIRIFGEFARADLGWAFGSSKPKIVSGIITWVGIVAVVVVVHLVTRPHPNPLPRREREGRGSQEL